MARCLSRFLLLRSAALRLRVQVYAGAGGRGCLGREHGQQLLLGVLLLLDEADRHAGLRERGLCAHLGGRDAYGIHAPYVDSPMGGLRRFFAFPVG